MLFYSLNISFCIVYEVVDLKNHDFDSVFTKLKLVKS
jgi:hypothetical protein